MSRITGKQRWLQRGKHWPYGNRLRNFATGVVVEAREDRLLLAAKRFWDGSPTWVFAGNTLNFARDGGIVWDDTAGNRTCANLPLEDS